MEKWNSRKARELGMNPELLNAVNAAVKAGRQELTRLSNIAQLRSALESGDCHLYDMARHRHGALFVDHDIAVECGLIDARFIIAETPEQVLTAIADANLRTFESDPKSNRHPHGEWGDLRTPEGVLEHLIAAEVHESLGGFRFEPLTKEEWKKGVAAIEVELKDLAPFRLKYGTAEWEEAFDMIHNPTTCAVSSSSLAMDFLEGLNPELAGQDHVQKVVRALTSRSSK